MRAWKAKIHLISQEFFQYSLVTYLILLLAETLKDGFVSYFFDLNILLGFVIIDGIIMVLTHVHVLEKKAQKRAISDDIIYSTFFAFGGAFLVHYKTQELGKISLVIAGLTFCIILLLSFLILTENEDHS